MVRPMKTCNICKRELPTLAFAKNVNYKDGLNCYCITCARAKNAEWRSKYVSNSRTY